ncbi:MAG: hypothetical protein COW01_03660 [Bdellovibrionales bacterium CG12_big_fil_rev_8_21_14_0_65_38_15]|nr:MAG: hypothetical protein COW01_03660 [Bdellovibrionales bacterium CG12_big_fil_rev_8_21_14_0_65_38_15]
MKMMSIITLLLIPLISRADLSTAFLVVRLDIEDIVREIDAESYPERSLESLETALLKLKEHKNKVFAPVFNYEQEQLPLSGLDLTRMHSYLKIHLTILERGLALADAQSRYDDITVDENAMALMTISLLEHRDVYLDNDRVRRLLDKKDEAYDVKRKALRKAYERFTNKKIEKSLRRAIEKELVRKDLATQIKTLRGEYKIVRKSFKGDFWDRIKTFVVHHISGFIGNRAGSVKFRKGMMWQDQELNNKIESMLLPMDIITEKTPFILTDKLIPGHFGHNSFWLGTEAELKKMGIWDQEYFKPYQAAVKQGYNIIETDRSGTHLKKLSEWMNIDEIAVIRRNDRPTEFKAINEFYAVLMAQHGKTYDFNFDVETTDKLVCSELLYQAFGDVRWPTEAYLGRFTISPDNVAEVIVQKNTPFELIYSHERGEDKIDHLKGLEQLASDLGYVSHGHDESGVIFEKETRKCIDLVKENGKVVKSCVKAWLRPVFGGEKIIRWDYQDGANSLSANL